MLLTLSDWVLLGDVRQDVVEGLAPCSTVLSPPHELVQVALEEWSTCTQHALELLLGRIPHAFHILSMNSAIPWIDIVCAMVNGPMNVTE